MDTKGCDGYIKQFINHYGIAFLTEDQLRFGFIQKLELTHDNAEIEKPYILKNNGNENNNGILSNEKNKDLLKDDSRARLDLYYLKDGIKNYVEFKYHYSYDGDCPNTKFGKVMNDLHRLSLLANALHDPENKKFYFVYCFNNEMKTSIEEWGGKQIIDKELANLFLYPNKNYSAKNYVQKNKFWNKTKERNNSWGFGEFRKESFSSFICNANDDKKNESQYGWLPKDNNKDYNIDFLTDIEYNNVYWESIGDLTLVVLEITKNVTKDKKRR